MLRGVSQFGQVWVGVRVPSLAVRAEQFPVNEYAETQMYLRDLARICLAVLVSFSQSHCKQYGIGNRKNQNNKDQPVHWVKVMFVIIACVASAQLLCRLCLIKFSPEKRYQNQESQCDGDRNVQQRKRPSWRLVCGTLLGRLVRILGCWHISPDCSRRRALILADSDAHAS